MLQGVCDNLIETRVYFSAWIVLLDNLHNVVLTAEAGLGKKFLPMIELFKKGEFTECSRNAITQSNIIINENPYLNCADCSLSRKNKDRGAMTIQLEYRGKILGLLSVSIPQHLVNDKEEQDLFKEIAGDIALGLYMIDIEEERKETELNLKRSEERYRRLINNLSDTIIEADVADKFIYLSPQFYDIFGYQPKE